MNGTETAGKHIPVRQCAGCGKRLPKGEMIRILRTPDGRVLLDSAGKADGRGSYLCKNPDCLRKARKKRRVESSLGCGIPDEIYKKVQEELMPVDNQ